MIIKPIGERCLVQPFRGAKETQSGLIMSQDSNISAAPVRGTVIEPGARSQFKKGDEILYRRYSVDELKMVTEVGEVVVYLVEDQDVLAVIEEK